MTRSARGDGVEVCSYCCGAVAAKKAAAAVWASAMGGAIAAGVAFVTRLAAAQRSSTKLTFVRGPRDMQKRGEISKMEQNLANRRTGFVREHHRSLDRHQAYS